MSRLNEHLDEIRQLAEDDLWSFAVLTHPERMYGDIHREAFRFLQNTENPNCLLLLPRGHMKSHCIAVWCAWWITKHPDTTILYVSATSTLAESQLYAIKNILTSKKYKEYWPDMVHPEEGKRAKWSTTAIAVDHPVRRKEGVRDMTVTAAGLTTNTTGLHADVIVADDVVVPDNAYTAEGRRKCAAAMSQMASILNAGGMIKACGTRYHPDDQYNVWKDQMVLTFDDDGECTGNEPLWDIMEEVVEVNGKFLWPRSVRDDGKAFGFDARTLATISTMYTDRTQFYAQYYNDPNDPESNRMDDTRFQYYDEGKIRNVNGFWHYGDKKLKLFAAMDFAFSTKKSADFTSIVVIGMDAEENIYVLDIDRFRTDKMAEYIEHLEKMHIRWQFPVLRAEVNVGADVIVKDIKNRIKVPLKIDAYRPTRNEGTKEERIAAALEPRYNDLKMYHFKGGHTPALEEELVLARPRHDDIKDCLACAVSVATPPLVSKYLNTEKRKIGFNKRFGGVQRI
jgi:hypothetical protein